MAVDILRVNSLHGFEPTRSGRVRLPVFLMGSLEACRLEASVCTRATPHPAASPSLAFAYVPSG